MTSQRFPTASASSPRRSSRCDRSRSASSSAWARATSGRPRPASRISSSTCVFKGSERYDQVEIAEGLRPPRVRAQRVHDARVDRLPRARARRAPAAGARRDVRHGRAALFEDDALESEREVVLEEIAMIEDDPSDLVHDLSARCVFGEHELGRPVIGSAATVRGLTNAGIAEYHASRYGAGNVVVAAAGNIEHDAFCAPRRRAPEAERGDARRSAGSDLLEAGRRSSSHATPSSTTWCSRRPGSAATTSAASRWRCSITCSAARPPRGSSRRSASSAAWPTASTATRRATTMRARSASTSARAARTWGSASRSHVRRSPTWARAVSRRTSSSAPRRASRAACCWRSNRRRRACRGSAAPCSAAARSSRSTRLPAHRCGHP